MKKSERERLRELLGKATPGPWHNRYPDMWWGLRWDTASVYNMKVPIHHDNAAAIAAMRNNLPSLLDGYEEALAVILWLRAEKLRRGEWRPSTIETHMRADKLLEGEG